MAVHRFRKHNPFGPDLRSIFFYNALGIANRHTVSHTFYGC